MVKVPNRKLRFERLIHPNTYDVYTYSGDKLGATYKTGKVWTIAGPTGDPLEGEFPSRAVAGEALWQALEARYAAAQEADRTVVSSEAPALTAGLPAEARWHFARMANHPDRVDISLSTPTSTLGEFLIHWIELNGQSVPRLECFDESWRLLSTCGLLEAMATWPEGITPAQAMFALNEWATGGPEILTPESPCTARVTPGKNGAITVAVDVPTYEGGATFSLSTERDADGDWLVYLPGWPQGIDEDRPYVVDAAGHEASNGILYLGAPDVEVAWRS